MSNFSTFEHFFVVQSTQFVSHPRSGISSACTLPINGCFHFLGSIDSNARTHKSPNRTTEFSYTPWRSLARIPYQLIWLQMRSCPTNAIIHFVLLLGEPKRKIWHLIGRTALFLWPLWVCVRSFTWKCIHLWCALYNVWLFGYSDTRCTQFGSVHCTQFFQHLSHSAQPIFSQISFDGSRYALLVLRRVLMWESRLTRATRKKNDFFSCVWMKIHSRHAFALQIELTSTVIQSSDVYYGRKNKLHDHYTLWYWYVGGQSRVAGNDESATAHTHSRTQMPMLGPDERREVKKEGKNFTLHLLTL